MRKQPPRNDDIRHIRLRDHACNLIAPDDGTAPIIGERGWAFEQIQFGHIRRVFAMACVTVCVLQPAPEECAG